MKKIIIPLLILFVFFGPFLLNYNFETIKANGSKSYWSLKSFIHDNIFEANEHNDYYNQLEKPKIYRNDCKYPPYLDNQMIEIQFAKTRLRYPCGFSTKVGYVRTLFERGLIQKNQYLEFSLAWSKFDGLLWSHLSTIATEVQYDFIGSMVIRKNSNKFNKSEKISYPKISTYDVDLFEKAQFVEQKQEFEISVYEYNNPQAKNSKNIFVKIDDELDALGKPIILKCSISTKYPSKGLLLNSTENDIGSFCTLRWYFSSHLSLKIINFKIETALNLKQFYMDTNTQFTNFVISTINNS